MRMRMKKLFFLSGILLLQLSLGVAVAQTSMNGESSSGQYPQTKSLLYLAGLYRQSLGLSEAQINAIKTSGTAVSDLKEQHSATDLSKYELVKLKEILSDNQFERFLVLKNRPIAEKLVVRVWNGMIVQQLVTPSDSTKLYFLVRTHLLSELITRDYFIDDPVCQQKHLDELGLKAPSVLFKYLHNGQSRPSEKNPYRADFIW